ncbi:hypothetical protein Tco_1286332 [Tanacetum coccineum]
MVLMNRVCKPYLDKFVIDFIDNIMIYSKFKEEYEVHLKLILKLLEKEKLFWKFSKCKANVVADALNRKERMKPKRALAMSITIHSSIKARILEAKSEASKGGNNPAEMLKGLDKYVKCAPFEALYGRKFRAPIAWAEVRERKLIGPEIVPETTNKIVQIKERLKATRDHKKSYADNWRKLLEFSVDDKGLLRVSPWKGVVRFGKGSKLSLRYVGPFKIVERVGTVAYRLHLPQEIVGIHDTFHVSKLKKFLADVNLHVPLEEIKIDNELHFVKEPIEIIDREVKKLKQSRIPIVKVRWNSRRGPDYN